MTEIQYFRFKVTLEIQVDQDGHFTSEVSWILRHSPACYPRTDRMCTPADCQKAEIALWSSWNPESYSPSYPIWPWLGQLGQTKADYRDKVVSADDMLVTAGFSCLACQAGNGPEYLGWQDSRDRPTWPNDSFHVAWPLAGKKFKQISSSAVDDLPVQKVAIWAQMPLHLQHQFLLKLITLKQMA